MPAQRVYEVAYEGSIDALHDAVDGAMRGGEWKLVGSKLNPKHFFSANGAFAAYVALMRWVLPRFGVGT